MSKGQRTRREIVDRALAAATNVGLENVTLGTLAAELDLSKSGLFAHFRSKEALQLAVLQEAIDRFTTTVVRPALAAPRGEPRLRALFEGWMGWIEHDPDAGGGTAGGRCIFMALSQEYDDRPGELRDAVVRSQQDWRTAIARAAQLGVAEGHFRPDADVYQVAFEFVGIGMTYQQTRKLLADPAAARRAHVAFEALLDRCRATPGARPPVSAGRRRPSDPPDTDRTSRRRSPARPPRPR
jgi:AcrR family transcriptional regulator